MFIHVLIEREGDEFVAHALDFDLMSSADTLDGAVKAIQENIAAYVFACRDMGLEPKEYIRKAPDEFYEEYNRAFRDKSSFFFVGRMELDDLLPRPREESAALV